MGVPRILHAPVTLYLLPQAKLAFEVLELDKEFHPFILGPNGSQAKAISEQTHARINIPPHSMMKSEITVAGDKECVAQAVAQIKKIYMDMVCGYGCGLWVWSVGARPGTAVLSMSGM